MVPKATRAKKIRRSRPLKAIVRVQTGIRIERRILKVLKALAEYKDMTLGDLLEGIVLHAFEGKLPFQPTTLSDIQDKASELDEQMAQVQANYTAQFTALETLLAQLQTTSNYLTQQFTAMQNAQKNA